MSNYKINLQLVGLKDTINRIKQFSNLFTSREFKDYISKKSMNVLNDITAKYLNEDKTEQYNHTYRSGHGLEVKTNEIVLFNDTKVDLSGLSEETLGNYPDGLSLAKLVEYGTGIVGQESSASQYAKNWEYDVNNHGNKGWWYEKGGKLYWTKGIEGRLIYLRTKIEIENNIVSWIKAYVKRKVK